ncbi:MAG: hypothetical protein ACPGVD_05395, partial [Flavobacteriales bacterium]
MKIENKIIGLILGVILIAPNSLLSREWIGSPKRNNANQIAARSSNCAPATQNRVLEFNNASAYIENSGLLWYNRSLGRASYIIPKDAGTSPIYAGGLWMGGVDPTGQLKLAAIRFRNQGNDYWPGPLTVDHSYKLKNNQKPYGNAETSQEECSKWDKFYVISRKEVALHRAWIANPSDYPDYTIPKSIKEWPAHGNSNQDRYIAPFFDSDNDGTYDPEKGDYPHYHFEEDEEYNCRSTRDIRLFGDKTIWWIFNDKG